MAQPLQMPSAFDQQQQVQHVQAMMAMAAASMTPGSIAFSQPAPTQPAVAPSMDAAMTQATPPMDPALAQVYSQVFAQCLQAQQFANSVDSTSMGSPGMVQQSYTTPGSYMSPGAGPATIQVAVEGMKFQYRLTDDDLFKVFTRYGGVRHIRVDEAGTVAQITFEQALHAQNAMTDLNGKVLNGLEGTLCISWATVQGTTTPAMPSPYPMMTPFSGWGYSADMSSAAWQAPGAAEAAAAAAMQAAAATQPTATVAGLGGADAAGAAVAPVSMPLSVATAGEAASGDGRGTAPAHVKGVKKYTCRFLIGIENDKEFQVVRRIIGAKGCNMKRIVKQTEAKLRLRGVGSGYYEGAGQKESTEPLQLCVSCTSTSGYHTAVKMVEELLETVYNEYRSYCVEVGRTAPDLHATPQTVPTGRGGKDISVLSSGDDDDDFGDQGEGSIVAAKGGKERRPRGRRSRGGKKSSEEGNKGGTKAVERGDPPPMAPPVEEIEKMIDQRNEARRQCNFAEADRIRQSLHERGVALMDEPGARGKGTEVTTWRYWRE